MCIRDRYMGKNKPTNNKQAATFSSMIKCTRIILLFALVAIAFSACDNPLLDLPKVKEILLNGGTTGLLTTPQTYSSLPVCKNILEGKPSCCSDTLIQDMANRWNTFKTKMSGKSKEHTTKTLKGSLEHDRHQ
eukprot:TRINITY_DN9513_c0_g1_i8.p4 TRINITY_DN9513_c0_g1~~TRINITY_DN9513_c0_g1_i8.p4  ORF type:complete len:133 (-),score=37.94 TRINITY_DN9513_c0_g1_i8:921-1319(-)